MRGVVSPRTFGTICGMYAATEDRSAPPLQVVHGFLDDFVAEMEQRGGLAAPVRYGKTFTRVHDPLVWREAADGLLAKAGVEVLFHTTVIEALPRMPHGRSTWWFSQNLALGDGACLRHSPKQAWTIASPLPARA